MFKCKLLKITYGTNGRLIQVTHHISDMYIGGDESSVSMLCCKGLKKETCLVWTNCLNIQMILLLWDVYVSTLSLYENAYKKSILKRVFLLEIDVNEKRCRFLRLRFTWQFMHFLSREKKTLVQNRCRKNINCNGVSILSDYFRKFSLLSHVKV